MKKKFDTKKRLGKLLAVIMAFALCITSLSIPAFASSSDTTTITIEAKYYQSAARSMLEMINDLRTSEEDAWYWNRYNTEKVYLTDLEELVYDYSLEEVAMQRAAEIAVSFSHTRPNGTTWSEAGDGIYVYFINAENLAAGYTSALAAFTGLAEEDEYYSGQGHRRNMLSASYTSVGMACVYYNYCYYWVMNFGSTSAQNTNTTETEACDSTVEVEVEILNSYIESATLALSEESVTLTKGETAELPTVTFANATVKEHWPEYRYVTGTVSEDDVTWESEDTSIASIGSIVANSVGTTTFTATVADSYTATLTVTVEAASIEGFTATLSEDTYEYDGMAKTPSVTVTDTNGNTLTADTDYTVSYSDNTQVGTATVTITGIGDYTGTLTKTFTITECSHNYESETTKEATCSEEGIMAYTCSKCGYTYTETIEKLVHTEGDAVIENKTDATCTEDGSYDTVIHCSVCGEEISRETTAIAATGHAYDYDNIAWAWADDYSSATAMVTCTNDSSHTYTYEAEISATADSSTCEEGGEITYTASITAGGVTYSDTVKTETEATGHTAGDAVIENEVDATCTETGSYDSVVYCSVCGKELSRETIITDALGHSYDDGVVTTEATCTKEGVMTYTCTVCGDTYTESINKLAHTEGDAVIENEVDATCTETGSYDSIVYCSVCGEEISRETVTVEALGHSYDDGEVTTEPTCTEEGIMTYTCSVCGDTYTESIEATGHTFGEWVTTISPTCTEAGSHYRTCSVCGYTEYEDMDATGHTWEDDYTIDVAATCTTDGSKSIHCSVCDATTDSVVIPATGHSYDEGTVTKEATCTEEGEIVYTCTECGDTYTDTIAMADHSYVGVVTQEATCTEEGVMTYTCSVCGDTYTESIDATGHTKGDAVVENEIAATCTEEGSYESVIYCTVCGEEISRETVAVEALGHSYNDGIVTTEATCTQDGAITFTCSVCGDTYTATVDALGHSYDSGTVTKEATVDEEGEITYTCTECGDTYTESIEKLSTTDDTDDSTTDADDDAAATGQADNLKYWFLSGSAAMLALAILFLSSKKRREDV